MLLAQKNNFQRLAEYYTEEMGLRVLPCKGKIPITPHGCKDASADLAQIASWWGNGQNHNIGIATGNGIVVLDVDVDHDRGKYGDETLADLERQYGKLPDTWTCLSGGGGVHYYFACDDPALTVGVGFAPGLDYRGTGGYAIAPPSIHPDTGRAYEWEASSTPTNTALAPLPDWLHNLMLQGKTKQAKGKKVSGKITEGQRNDELFRLAASLRARGLTVEEITAAVMEANKSRCTPPLSEDEVESICNSAGRYERGETSRRIDLDVVSTALDELEISVRYNQLLKETEIKGLPCCYSQESAVNILPTYLMDYLKSCSYKGVSQQAVDAYLFCIADQNRYNPIKDYLQSGTWDGVDRFPEIYRILGVTEPKYQTYIQKWFIQCVALGLNDEDEPIGADGVLVLQGEQGLAKTSFFRIMSPFPRWFVEGAIIDMGTKDSLITALSGWITELGELDSTIKKEQSSLKAFITRPEDRIRAPYARNDTRAPRRTSFCGTVNPKDYLKDETGSRRFWTVPVTNTDKKALFSLPRDWVNQLWYQAYQMYLADPAGFRLTDKEVSTLQEDNREFEQALPYEVEIRELLDCTLPVERWEWWKASTIAKLIPGNASAVKVGKALSRVGLRLCEDHPGWSKTSRVIHGATEYLLPLSHSRWLAGWEG